MTHFRESSYAQSASRMSSADARRSAGLGTDRATLTTDTQGELAALADWQDDASYTYTHALTREAWAWEFLRRNPLYRAAWSVTRSTLRNRASIVADASLRFGLVVLEDPTRTALDAQILWREEASSYVLPLRAEDGCNATGHLTFDLSALRTHAAVDMTDGPTQHVLFVDQGRRVQLAVQGADLFGRVRLLADAPLEVTHVKRRTSLLRRLAHALHYQELPARLFPPDPRGRRLAVILRALDGWLANTSQRRIGEAVLDGFDVERDWRDCPCELRDRVRLTLRRGRWLMEEGYRTLLQ